MKTLFSLLLLSLFTFSTKAQESNHIIIDKTDFHDSINAKKVVLLDVRRAEEFEAGHIEQALNFNVLDSLNFRTQVEQLDPATPVYLYCRSGNRSGKAAVIMQEMGFQTLYDLKGGYLGWVEEKAAAAKND
ncbi:MULTISPECIES: rhodanese-like domain-containing protein [unclassified Leeuwenhoekiella]|uniref:rhodanese-like domain-containing protein n=1 Tax=unclassified Leeuwenhoekiella TaxID=2615029 RepID=UPI000C53BC2A|nr:MULTISPECIES: rhodanese-like domain-containing protein [unclassified Leeuwenhoekiella]MAW94719.1 rhodanese [Leeuwenhoekiella sp.]MAW95494.1 rhodanese [Leeuwenhoekiella sp.]MBA82142.1 rhodanese [Leeuwenhoekiella sp.]|tara:strand:- start:12394 stop:12786 length:393 start_codon:yes stop_codon:yes gene_type:complete